MFSTFLEKLSSFFDKHWLLRYFFPSLVFWSAGLAVYGAAKGITEPVDLWQRQPPEVQVILLTGALLWVTLFAYLIGNFGTALIRLFEGYWERPPLRWLRKRRQGHYERLYRYLEAAEKDQIRSKKDPYEFQRLQRELWLCFPRGEMRMPTRLGNIIRAAEVYPLHRYGADAVILWPRLQPFLPPEFIETFNGAQTAMEVMLVLSVLSFVFSTIACTLLATLTLNLGLFLTCTVGFILAWICYRNSLQSALGYAELIKTAFDLYRGKLLEGLGLEPPSDPDQEWAIWNDVSKRIFYNASFLKARFKGAAIPKPEPVPQTRFGKALTELLTLMRLALPKAAPPAPVAIKKPPPTQTFMKEPHDIFPYAYFGTLLSICLIGAWLIGDQARQPAQRVVLTRDVPAYRLLTNGDLEIEQSARSEVSGDTFQQPDELSEKAYLIQPLVKGAALSDSGIRRVDSKQIAGRVAMGISATTATVLGGALRPGDGVDLVIAPAKDALPAPGCTELRGLLVLDVKTPEKGDSFYVVVLAVPAACQATLAGAASRISLARVL